MNKETKKTNPKVKPGSLDESLDSDFTAKPQGVSRHKVPPEFDPKERNVDYGEMNLRDAKISGYTDRRGRAVAMAKKDVQGSPTGALTDIGAGRSSVVHTSRTKKSEGNH